MTFGASEVARILKVDRSLVKQWAFHFAEQLEPAANPAKGSPRRFTPSDLRALAYIFLHWEESPDIEAIRIGLNCGNHLDDSFDEFVDSVTPIFQEPSEDLDETWRHGTIIGGMAEIADRLTLAESYKLAGDTLVDAALSSGEPFQLVYPIIYTYRHALELFLKASVPHPQTDHDLKNLFSEFAERLRSELQTSVPEWFEKTILAYHEFDPNSTTFRYGGFARFNVAGEVWVDLLHLKRVMGWFAKGFRNVRNRDADSRLEPGPRDPPSSR